MKKIALSALAILILSTVPLAHAQDLLARTQQRLLLRLERWEVICDRRETRQSERLLARGLSAPTTLSASDEACLNIRKRLAEVRGSSTISQEPETEPQSSPEPQPDPDPDLLPNQTFTPLSPLPSFDATNHILVLGEDAPAIATITITPDDEPVQIRTVKITLTAAASSISSFEVVDDIGFILGTASLDLDESSAGDIFTLDLSPQNAYFIEKDDRIILAVRPRTKTLDRGGESAEALQVQSIDLTAIGIWTSRANTVDVSGPDFQEHQTALAVVTAIERSGKAMGTFSIGEKKKIGVFVFRAESNSDSESNPSLQTLVFSVNAPSAVTLSAAYLRSNNVDTEHSCTITSSTITCSAIPASIGNLQSPRTLSLYADIAVTSHPDPFLQVELNRPGGPSSAGDITWSDGVSSFTWVEFDSPIARSTSWE